jgi:6-hydroxytryprostatin B O-methyltransferase
MMQIGGSTGHVSFELASVHHKLKCIVQDRSNLEVSFNSTLPAALADRVSFQVHDFFTPEPVHGADVYLFKGILLDCSDPYAIKILQQVVPAMKVSSRILIMEGVIPPAGKVPLGVARTMSGLDIQMLTALNSRLRTAEDWAALFKRTDERLTLVAINQTTGSPFAIIEAALQS